MQNPQFLEIRRTETVCAPKSQFPLNETIISEDSLPSHTNILRTFLSVIQFLSIQRTNKTVVRPTTPKDFYCHIFYLKSFLSGGPLPLSETLILPTSVEIALWVVCCDYSHHRKLWETVRNCEKRWVLKKSQAPRKLHPSGCKSKILNVEAARTQPWGVTIRPVHRSLPSMWTPWQFPARDCCHKHVVRGRIFHIHRLASLT